ncbi:MAG: SET domain-containing protein [Streptomycetaceae bacterium]|nr:SET domain-containing protein [Streptomycetaceae bacterium]
MVLASGVGLRNAADRGEGVFATRSFLGGELVLVGVIEAELDHNDAHASQIDEGRFVRHGGLMPKVNHSCDPNCGIRLNVSGAHDLVSRFPIAAGQEITFDYAMRNYTIKHFPARCQCRTPRCRGRITGWKDLPSDRKAAYQGFVAPYLLDLEGRHTG